jgi:2-phospho-L-lactate guanylyltransferase
VTRADAIWAVVPVKEFSAAKQRLGGILSQEQRAALAACMVEDVLAALAQVPGLAGLMVVTCDPFARGIAERAGARIAAGHAREGQTAAVAAAAQLLAAEGANRMLAVPGDIPLISSAEVSALLRAHQAAPAFSIAPARDGRGSNAVLCSPPNAVPLSFGDDSFLPHLAAARRAGIEPTVRELPGIGLDIDLPEDFAELLRRAAPHNPSTRTLAWLHTAGFLG